VFSALLSFLSAHSKGGKWVLRIEDLDPERSRKEYADMLEDDLNWLGLVWDEGGSKRGDFGPYYQSERSKIYEEAFNKLSHLIYPCFCKRADLLAASAPHSSDGRPIYSGKCRDLTPADVAEMSKLRNPAYRIKVGDAMVKFTDGVYGVQEKSLYDVGGDFVLRRIDGTFAYQLAVVVDDAAMGITEVVRGNDLLDSTPSQIYLYNLLGLPVPQFYHFPLLMSAESGARLSKRDKSLDMGELRKRYSAEEILGLLGFYAGIIPENRKATLSELLDKFSWEKVPKKNITVSNI
jgi:glutamyl-tRNA synthetase